MHVAAGLPYHNGSRNWSGWVPPQDSEMVRRFKAAGLIILGSTKVPVLSLTPVTEPRHFGRANNPWALDRTTGGSLGGSAAHVAARGADGPYHRRWRLDPDPSRLLRPFRGAFRFMPFSPIWNITGQPAAILPLHWTPDGLPVGVQAVARFGQEATLFSFTAQMEQAYPWSPRVPLTLAESGGTLSPIGDCAYAVSSSTQRQAVKGVPDHAFPLADAPSPLPKAARHSRLHGNRRPSAGEIGDHLDDVRGVRFGKIGRDRYARFGETLMAEMNARKAGKPRPHQRSIGEGDEDGGLLNGHNLHESGGAQARRGSSAISPDQTAAAQEDTAKPARYDDGDVVELKPIDGLEDRLAGGAAGLAIVAEPVGLTNPPGPAIVVGGRIRMSGD